MPECMLGLNCKEKQADPGVHFLTLPVLVINKNEKRSMHVKRHKPLPHNNEFEGPGGRRFAKKLCLPTFSPYPTMFSTIDRNCRQFCHINFLCQHVQRQLAGNNGEWVFTLRIFNQLDKDMILT